MKVSAANDVKIYNVSAGKTLPEWLSDRKKRSMQKDDVELMRRIQLIQDFSMPTASSRIKMTRDGNYILAAGTYKPRIRCYEVAELGMKFERFLTADVVQFEVLSDDYSKLALLHSDRSIEFHAQYGGYYKTRIPKFGRDMQYHFPSCDLFVVGASHEVYRLNLEQGRFLAPFVTKGPECNVIVQNTQFDMLAIGTTAGIVECWDPRSRACVGSVDAGAGLLASSEFSSLLDGAIPEITSVRFDGDGLTMAVGTSTGHVLVYDVRARAPLRIKDHQYGFPIRDIRFHEASRQVVSADAKAVKIWDKDSGKNLTSIEPPADINELCLVGSSGLFFVASEDPAIQTFYVPALGPAPRWCAFLDNLTEELEETTQGQVYDDYKFVTRKELDELGLSHLVGTNVLRAYMHGFFMDIRLYQEAKAISEPFAYKEYRQEKLRKKIEETRENRIRLQRKLPKVNAQLAKRLLDNEVETGEPAAGPNPLQDQRFGALFTNPDFQVDVDSHEFRLLHPSSSNKSKKAGSVLSNFEPVNEDEEESGSEDDGEETGDITDKKRSAASAKSGPAKKPKFFEVRDTSLGSMSKKSQRASFGERLRSAPVDESSRVERGAAGGKELTFQIGSSKLRGRENGGGSQAERHHRENQRGVRELKLKKKGGPVFWRGKIVKK